MDKAQYRRYLQILELELVPALGCTEPISVAYASAKAREILSCMPEHIELYCSGNIIKNTKSVTVPNSGGMRGIEAAAVLGAVGGDPSSKLEVLERITPEDLSLARKLLSSPFCSCHLQKNAPPLYIRVEMRGGGHLAKVAVADDHTNIILMEKDGDVLFAEDENSVEDSHSDLKSHLNVADILTFAREVKADQIRDLMERQILLNTAISTEGLNNSYGAQVGKTLLQAYGNDVRIRACAAAAAGSDARMNGCPLPVVINSGSGNQGMTCSLPVIEYAKELKVSRDTLYRALVISNLISIHQKRYIGSLSAYCGAVSAACGAGAAITWLHGGDYTEVSRTITNTIANTGGMICDGAKSSCAAKIASAVNAAILAFTLEKNGRCFQPGEGLVGKDVEDTIRNLGHVGKEGMKETDVTILKLMLNCSCIPGGQA